MIFAIFFTNNIYNLYIGTEYPIKTQDYKEFTNKIQFFEQSRYKTVAVKN